MTKKDGLKEESLSKVSGGNLSPTCIEICNWTYRNNEEIIKRYQEKHSIKDKKTAELDVEICIGYAIMLDSLPAAIEYIKNHLDIDIDGLE